MDTLTFDIETIPQSKPLTEIQQEELDKRLGKLQLTGNEYEKAKSLFMATNPYFGEIVCIGLMKTKDNVFDTIALTGDESSILNRFWNILAKFKGTYVSFNGLGFDVPFIVKRSMLHKITPTSADFLNLKRFSNYPHCDVKLVLGDWDRFAIGTLRLVCEFLDIPSPKEGDIKAEDVEQAFKDGRIDAIGEYCLRDVIATHAVYKEVKKYISKPTNQYN